MNLLLIINAINILGTTALLAIMSFIEVTEWLNSTVRTQQ
jgi:hypothetical protein